MKPSEAMRAGAAITEPAVGCMISKDGKRACALGAMAIGAFGLEDALHNSSPYQNWRLFQEFKCLTQDTPGTKKALYSEIMALNDQEGFTREQIAAWLESKGL